jgi:hypothetical protein
MIYHLSPVVISCHLMLLAGKVRKPKVAAPPQRRQQPAAPADRPAAPVPEAATVEPESSGFSFYVQVLMAGAALFLANKAGLFRALLRGLN